MLARPDPKDGSLQRIQISRYAQCALFSQTIDGETVEVRYLPPTSEEDVPNGGRSLRVPLTPNVKSLQPAHMSLHHSKTEAYRMGEPYDAWFSAVFGFQVRLIFIGDHRRPVLGSFAPGTQPREKGTWLSRLSRPLQPQEKNWLTFSDCAPFLITSEASLAIVQSRVTSEDTPLDASSPATPVELMSKFRPNIVLDGDAAWEEDFWSSLVTGASKPVFALSKMCNRCASLNVDYTTGKPGAGDNGALLKKLMVDRRVDKGAKYSPVFGRYAFLAEDTHQRLSVGQELAAGSRAEERPVWDWPSSASAARSYNYGRSKAGGLLPWGLIPVVLSLLFLLVPALREVLRVPALRIAAQQ